MVGEAGVGHRFAFANAPVDPGSLPSQLRHSTLQHRISKKMSGIKPDIFLLVGHLSGCANCPNYGNGIVLIPDGLFLDLQTLIVNLNLFSHQFSSLV